MKNAPRFQLRFYFLITILCSLILNGCSIVRENSPFFKIPREQVIELSTQKVDWLRDLPNPHGELSDEMLAFEDAVDDHLEQYGSHVPPGKEYSCISQFLAISDEQIRDEEVYAQGKSNYIDQLLYFDRFYGVTIRRSFVEKFDSLTFASFLIAYRKEVEAAKKQRETFGLPDPFIIQTGDMLDISTTTEVLTALSTARACLPEKEPPYFYSMAGNHDGLIFGNLPNDWVDMQSIGINLSEFVLAHLLIDSEINSNNETIGFGFGESEIVKRFHAGSFGLEYPRTDQYLKSEQAAIGKLAGGIGIDFSSKKYRQSLYSGIRGMGSDADKVYMLLGAKSVNIKPDYSIGWKGKAARQARQIITAAEARSCPSSDNGAPPDAAQPENFTENLYVPMIFSDKIEVTDGNDGGEIQTGYYHWDQEISPSAGEVSGIRYIALDTRSKEYSANGQVGLVQLGWLYNQLADALKRHYAVVIFGHHPPNTMQRSGWTGNIMDKATTEVFFRMLERFPNIIAYFYGHSHWNENLRWPDKDGRLPIIQTGSLADFPQVGRSVWVYAKQLENDAYEGVVSWEFVRPRGSETRQGEILDSLLSTSQKESMKEFNDNQETFEANLHRGSTGWGLWEDISPMWKKVDGGIKAWQKENLDYGEARVTFSFEDSIKPEQSFFDFFTDENINLLSAVEIFGSKRRLKKTNKMRQYLGCPKVIDTPELIQAEEKPDFASPSGIAMLQSGKGHTVLIMGDESNARAIYRATLPSDTTITKPLGLAWKKISLKDSAISNIEGVAKWSDREVFVIGSQSRSEKKEDNIATRSRLGLVTFNDDITDINGTPDVCDNLRMAILGHLKKCLDPHDINMEALVKKRPAGGGLNVEGIVRWDNMLLIGLRDPVTSDGRQIILPLMNPVATVKKTAAPDFGPPLLIYTGPGAIEGRVVKWQPPSSSQIADAMKSDMTPIEIDLSKSTESFPDFTGRAIAGASVPEGICALENGAGFVIVRNPEVYDLNDVLVLYSTKNDLLK